MTAPNRMLTVKEVAHALRISAMSVYRLIEAKELPAIRVGRIIRVPERAFRAFLHTHEVGWEPQ